MINRFVGVGRLCADPELKYTTNNIANVRFRIAINRQFADKESGERKADFISCMACTSRKHGEVFEERIINRR